MFSRKEGGVSSCRLKADGSPRRFLMKLVVGLGNPGSEYAHTRHNVGFRVVDKLASKLGWKWSERRNRAILASGSIGLEKVVLAKPITFMNLSGQAVGELGRCASCL